MSVCSVIFQVFPNTPTKYEEATNLEIPKKQLKQNPVMKSPHENTTEDR